MSTFHGMIEPIVFDQISFQLIYMNYFEAKMFNEKSAKILIDKLGMSKFDLVFSLDCKKFEKSDSDEEQRGIEIQLTNFFSESMIEAIGHSRALIVTMGTSDDSFSRIINEVMSKVKKRHMSISVISIIDIDSIIKS